jgi:hypothetical protein
LSLIFSRSKIHFYRLGDQIDGGWITTRQSQLSVKADARELLGNNIRNFNLHSKVDLGRDLYRPPAIFAELLSLSIPS